MLVCSLFSANRTRDRGCSAHPVFPAPSIFEGKEFLAKLGRKASRERERASRMTCGHTLYCRPALDPGPIRRGTSVRTLALETFYKNNRRGAWGPGVRRDDERAGCLKIELRTSRDGPVCAVAREGRTDRPTKMPAIARRHLHLNEIRRISSSSATGRRSCRAG